MSSRQQATYWAYVDPEFYCHVASLGPTELISLGYPYNVIDEQDKSEGFYSCNRPSNLTQIWFKSSIFQPVWPWNLMDDPKKQ